MVSCIFKNGDKKPIDKASGYINGVGVIEKWLPSNMDPKFISCSEQ